MDLQALNTIVNGIPDDIAEVSKKELEEYAKKILGDFEIRRQNKESNVIKSSQTKANTNDLNSKESFNGLTALVNTDSNSINTEFSGMLDQLYEKNKKYFSIIKDYEIMPILIPQINRVLMFLVNESISPDIQSDKNFVIKYIGKDDVKNVNDAIVKAREDLSLDKLLRKVFYNRYKLGREYYRVIDYNKTFDFVKKRLENMPLNETANGQQNALEYLTESFSYLSTSIDVGKSLNEAASALEIKDAKIDFSKDFGELDIEIVKSPIVEYVETLRGEVLTEQYKSYSVDSIMNDDSGVLNEAVTAPENVKSIIDNLVEKKLTRCVIDRLDPARVFKLKVSGRVIGYFYTQDIQSLKNKGNATLNLAQSLKDRLIKSKANNTDAAYNALEKTIAKTLSEKIINTFDANIGINRIEDIDLLHDYIISNEIYNGNKKITFFYKDDVIDISREEESILTNAVFFTKLYATLILNNIMTKVLRGRGRQIHTINMGASNAVQKYIENAIAALTMPESRLGSLNGTFDQIMNPLNGSSDIVIPVEDGGESIIRTDLIEGQNVDMDVDILKFLLNSIVISFGLDSAVLDVTNGNIDFAKTLSMLSVQIVNLVKGEQNDAYPGWKKLVLDSLSSFDETLCKAIEQGQIEVELYTPKSAMLTMSADELNNARSYAETLADNIPELQNDDIARSFFIYYVIKGKVSLDWEEIDDILESIGLDVVRNDLVADLKQRMADAKTNRQQQTADTGDVTSTEDDDTAALEDN